MSFLKKITELFASSGERDESIYWLHVKCNRCGEQIRTRINLHNDLSVSYGEGDADTTFYCRKVLMGEERCFQRIEVELSFDHHRKVINRQISGGEFITEEEYASLKG